MTLPRFPRSAKYDIHWVIENLMGPNALWLAESLLQVTEIEPGSRVLDLGCGKAVTSMFLAQELDAQVWAADLWIDPSENQQRIVAKQLTQRVFPLRVEAHAIPFGEGFFDAIVSFDAYHYFGTSDTYLPDICRFLKPSGLLGIVVPGLVAEIEELPDHLLGWWQPEMWSFHSPAWWRHHWQRTGLVEVVVADQVEDGWRLWESWCRLTGAPEEADAVGRDAGRNLGFSRVVAKKR